MRQSPASLVALFVTDFIISPCASWAPPCTGVSAGSDTGFPRTATPLSKANAAQFCILVVVVVCVKKVMNKVIVRDGGQILATRSTWLAWIAWKGRRWLLPRSSVGLSHFPPNQLRHVFRFGLRWSHGVNLDFDILGGWALLLGIRSKAVLQDC